MRRLQTLSDTELIHSLIRGHQKAFDVLFSRYKENVRKVVLHCVRDRMVTEDLLQDSFLKIYISLKSGKYNEQGKFLPWALRIVHNLCMDHLRKISLAPVLIKDMEDDVFNTAMAHNAENKMIAKQQGQYLDVLINSLPEEQKEVVRYRYFEELSFKEIAALMNTSVSTSLGRMRYGLSNLKRQMKTCQSFA